MKRFRILSFFSFAALLLLLTSCLGNSSMTYSRNGAWGTIEPDKYDGRNYIRLDEGILVYSELAQKMGAANRVVCDYVLDGNDIANKHEGEVYYKSGVSTAVEVPTEPLKYFNSELGVDTFGVDPIDGADLYRYITPTYVKGWTISLASVFSGANEGMHRIDVVYDEVNKFRGDTVALQLRHNAKGDTGAKRYGTFSAYDVTSIINSKKEGVIELKYDVTIDSKKETRYQYLQWILPEESN